jgi:hypothetical protein
MPRRAVEQNERGLRRDLAGRVGRHRPQRRVLTQREILGCDEPVLLGAADDEHRRLEAHTPHRVQHVHDAEHVGAQRATGIEPRLLDARLPRQVHDGVGPRLLDDRGGGRRVVEVGLDEADAPGRGTRQAAARRDDAVDASLRLFAP